jgi:hypothetical protein
MGLGRVPPSPGTCRDDQWQAHPEARHAQLASRVDGRHPEDKEAKAWVRGGVDSRLLRGLARELRPGGAHLGHMIL